MAAEEVVEDGEVLTEVVLVVGVMNRVMRGVVHERRAHQADAIVDEERPQHHTSGPSW